MLFGSGCKKSATPHASCLQSYSIIDLQDSIRKRDSDASPSGPLSPSLHRHLSIPVFGYRTDKPVSIPRLRGTKDSSQPESYHLLYHDANIMFEGCCICMILSFDITSGNLEEVDTRWPLLQLLAALMGRIMIREDKLIADGTS